MFEHCGRTLPLSPSRRLIADLMHACERVPTVTLTRRLRLAPLLAARRRVPRPRPAWYALFARACGVVAARRPELRQAYLTFPRPHLYEHPHTVVMVTVERRFAGQCCVFLAPLPAPEHRSLTDLHDLLTHYKSFPIPGIAPFRLALRVSRWPRPLRRLAWWAGLNLKGDLRARHFGTLGITSTASAGAAPVLIRSPLTATLHYGLLRPSGALDVSLTFDHRVLDGATAARALRALEAVLLDQVVAELTTLADRRAA